jgi:hypothetical protein
MVFKNSNPEEIQKYKDLLLEFKKWLKWAPYFRRGWKRGINYQWFVQNFLKGQRVHELRPLSF